MEKENFIHGIQNYCDRWCERCAFTQRCIVGHMEQQRWSKGDPHDVLMPALQSIPGLHPQLDAWIFDQLLNNSLSFKEEEIPEADMRIQKLDAAIFEKGMHYAQQLAVFLESHDARLKAAGIDLERMAKESKGPDHLERSALSDAIEVIICYQHLMFVKASRALNGLYDDEDTPLQSDANGSAKVTMLTSRQCVAAWQVVAAHWPELDKQIGRFVKQIQLLQGTMQQLFPNWQKFVRPGFDTEVTDTSFGNN